MSKFLSELFCTKTSSVPKMEYAKSVVSILVLYTQPQDDAAPLTRECTA